MDQTENGSEKQWLARDWLRAENGGKCFKTHASGYHQFSDQLIVRIQQNRSQIHQEAVDVSFRLNRKLHGLVG